MLTMTAAAPRISGTRVGRRRLAVAPQAGAVEAWHGPGFRWRRRAPAGQRWRWALWSVLLPPPERWRLRPTLPGVLLGVLALAIGGAAYNTANNILFITLSVLLSSLVLSAVLAWLNFQGLRWRLCERAALRAGVEDTVTAEVRNDKQRLPSYSLWFDLTADGRAQRAGLRVRLDPGERAEVEWRVRPARRGRLRLKLAAAGSVFPFGFLRQTVGIGRGQDVPVWPTATPYTWVGSAAGWRPHAGEQRAPLGPRGGDLRAVRRYAPGDPQRVVHWKASARARRLMVREFAAEREEGLLLWVQTSAERWQRAEQFELLCSLAATLAEDLFRAGRLRGFALDAEPAILTRRPADVEIFLNRLAEIETTPGPRLAAVTQAAKQGLMTFAPDGARGVAAYVDGIKTATA